MYYPFSILKLMHCPTAAKERRPIAREDTIALRQLALKLMERFDQDQRYLLIEHALVLMISGLIPLLGYWFLDWPLLLVAVVVVSNTLVEIIIDEIRSHRSVGKVRSALFFATQVEIAGRMINELIGKAGHEVTPVWRVNPNFDPGLARVSIFLIIALIVLIQNLLQEAGWALIAFSVLLPAVARVLTLFHEFSTKPPADDIDLRYLPQAPVGIIITVVGAAVGVVGYLLSVLNLLDPAWHHEVVLLGWLFCCSWIAIAWARNIKRTRLRFQEFLDKDRNFRRLRFHNAYRDTPLGKEGFLRQSLQQGNLWPPTWVDLRETGSPRRHQP